MLLIFWLSLAFVAYVYIGYPMLIAVWAKVSTALRRPRPRASGFEPGVSIVIAARNEARRLPKRIANLLSLDYPADRRQIIVVSDGSTDDTMAVLEACDGVESIALPPCGKAAALNAGVARARHEIVVFADARQVFAPDALRELTAPFVDRSIGGVSGELVLDAESELFANRRGRGDRRHKPRPSGDRRRSISSTIADGVGAYWRYEKALRRMESAIDSTLGVTGAIYAVRRDLWSPLPADTLLDDVLAPMRIVLNGHRVVFNDRARAFDSAAADADGEARRKVRTLAGNFQLLALEPRLLLPWRNPVWLQYLSHKIARLFVPYALLAAFAANIALSPSSFYAIVLALQVAFYLLAGCGAWLELAARPKTVESASAAAGASAVTAREVA